MPKPSYTTEQIKELGFSALKKCTPWLKEGACFQMDVALCADKFHVSTPMRRKSGEDWKMLEGSRLSVDIPGKRSNNGKALGPFAGSLLVFKHCPFCGADLEPPDSAKEQVNEPA